jgi:peptidyl-prolyl cis-trans isomerase A (cyclophilin A)
MRAAMIKLALAAAVLLAAPALAQVTVPSDLTGAPVPTTDLAPVAIDTSAGRIVVALDRTHAPKTTANFLAYVDAHKFDGESFYRAMPYDEHGGLIQGGIVSDASKLLKPVAHEPTDQTGIRNTAGAIAMANAGPGTARADFFILTTDIPGLDAGPDGPGFAAFGHVVEGMDVARKILASPVSPTKGEGAMKGQMLDPPIKIIKVSRVR